MCSHELRSVPLKGITPDHHVTLGTDGRPLDANVELSDVTLAVKGRANRGFLNPPSRELLSQQASELNVQPMPLLPRTSGVQLPPPEQWLPSARRFADGDADDSARAWTEP